MATKKNLRYCQVEYNNKTYDVMVAVTDLDHMEEAVNEALRDYAAKLRRAAEFDGYIQRAQEWDYEGWKELRALDKSGKP